MHAPYILAAGLPFLVEVAVILIVTLVVWIWGLITGDNKPAPPGRGNMPNPPPQGRNQKVNNEIEKFLQRVGQQREQQQQPSSTPRRPPQAKQPGNRPPNRDESRRPLAKSRTPNRAGSSKAEPPLMAEVIDEPAVGGSVADHVRQTFDTDKFNRRANRLTESVDQAVEQLREQVQHTFEHQVGHLTQTQVEVRSGSDPEQAYNMPTAPAPHPLLALLSNPGNTKHAVILSEIMHPPTQRWE